MSVDGPTGPGPKPEGDRRATGRFAILVPVQIQWVTHEGETAFRDGLAQNIDTRGALVKMKAFGHRKTCTEPERCRCGRLAGRHFPNPNTEIAVKNVTSGELVRARVTRVGRSRDGEPDSIGIVLLDSKDGFWGLTFQLQRTLMQLREIEDSFQAQDREMDFRVRGNLREAVEYVGAVGSAVQQWQDLRAQGKDGFAVLESLSSMRMDRATRLLRELTSDIDASEISGDSEQFADLVLAVDRLYDRMARGPVMVRDMV